MQTKVILFDLDGTLLPMDQEKFVKAYFTGIATRLAEYGYEPNQLIETIWAGIRAMKKNNGEKCNEAVFWDTASALRGEKILADKPYFDKFYREDFDKVQPSCGYTPKAAELMKTVKSLGYRVALATNPVFPAIATQKRIRWAGLSPEDFELYTTYENSHYCKPNPKYYLEIIQKLGVDPKECLMVGNDVGEDMPAETLGMKVFLLTDCLINTQQKDISAYPHGGFDELLDYVRRLKN